MKSVVNRRWCREEDLEIKKLYPDYKAIASTLPHRTRISLERRASMLGIVRSKPCRIWKANEARVLVRAYASGVPLSELKEMFPGLNVNQIRSKAVDLGARRPENFRNRRLSDPLLISIRKRARHLRCPLMKLDEIVGSGKYFRNSCPKIRLKHICGAIRALGGSITIEWED